MTAKDKLDTPFHDVHWLMDILQNIDVGLVVMDKSYRVKLWNAFMQNHSGSAPENVLGKSIFALFPELSKPWFERKTESVFVLQSTAFTIWEQRPYIFHFPHYRPITGTAEHVYQNCTIIPLTDTQGRTEHICLIIYDVTDMATQKLSENQGK